MRRPRVRRRLCASYARFRRSSAARASGERLRRGLLGFARGVWRGDARLLEDASPLFGQRRAALRIEAADFHVGAGADRLARERQMLVVEGDGDAGLEAFLDTEV